MTSTQIVGGYARWQRTGGKPRLSALHLRSRVPATRPTFPVTRPSIVVGDADRDDVTKQHAGVPRGLGDAPFHGEQHLLTQESLVFQCVDERAERSLDAVGVDEMRALHGPQRGTQPCLGAITPRASRR
jgi:hypothetical protein